MAVMRKLVTSWVGRLRERADHIDRRMEGKNGTVVLHYRVGRLMGVAFVPEWENADEMPVERS
jgi:hypothetical protein